MHQELGPSRSGYSLRNQLKFNPDFADVKPKAGKAIVSFEAVEKVIKKVRNEWGIASICDIVLNHTANESEWLLENPESTYSCFTMPHLRPAFLLDVVFSSVSIDTAAGYLENVGVPKLVETEQHIQVSRFEISLQNAFFGNKSIRYFVGAATSIEYGVFAKSKSLPILSMRHRKIC